jgi:hypothetical protein
MNAPACGQRCRGTDLVGSRFGWLVWGVPSALFLGGIAWGGARAWLWVPSLAVAGVACVANAARCGRLHCFVTGPTFLLAALVTVFVAAGVIDIDWRWILATVVAGTAAGYGLEWGRGKYIGAHATERSSS